MSNKVLQKNIPKGWQSKRFGDLTNIRTGKKDANAQVVGGRYPFFTCAQGISEIDGYTFDTEAVIVAGNGDFNVKYYKGKFDAYQRTYVIESKEGLLPVFLYYGTQYALPRITSGARGSTIQYLKIGDFTEFSFLLPPISEQKKIAEILSSVDEEIQKIDSIISETEKLKTGLMQDLFTKGIGHKKFKKTKIGMIPEEWHLSSIKESNISIIDGDRGINYPKSNDFSSDGYCLFLSTKNIKDDQFIFTESQFITQETDLALRKGKLQRNDVVLTTRGTVGNVAFYNEAVPFDNIRINSGMVLVRSGKDFLPEYVYHLFKSPLFKKRYAELASGSAQPQLPIRSLENILVPIPSLKEQKEIVEISQSLDKRMVVCKNLKVKLADLKKGLMSDLLSGKVRTITEKI